MKEFVYFCNEISQLLVYNRMKRILFLLFTAMACLTCMAQEIEKIDKFPTGYINGTYMNKYKSIDGVLYAVGYESVADWILVRYPAGCRNTTYTVHPNCRRIARGAFQGAAYLKVIYLPETVSYIGEDAFEGCTSLQGIEFGDGSPTAIENIDAIENEGEAEVVARYNLSGQPCSPNDKGVQIVVRSDYSAKTIFVE